MGWIWVEVSAGESSHSFGRVFLGLLLLSERAVLRVDSIGHGYIGLGREEGPAYALGFY